MYLALWWMFTMGVKTACWNLSLGSWGVGASVRVFPVGVFLCFWWFEICRHGMIVWSVFCIEESNVLLSKGFIFWGIISVLLILASYDSEFLCKGNASLQLTSHLYIQIKGFKQGHAEFNATAKNIVIVRYWSGFSQAKHHKTSWNIRKHLPYPAQAAGSGCTKNGGPDDRVPCTLHCLRGRHISPVL